MPKPLIVIHPLSKTGLAREGIKRVKQFCIANDTPIPDVTIALRVEWCVDACAYYRPDRGINICLEKCASPCSEEELRNWNWPGSTTDREPYGVICHELGHHCDWLTGERKWTYGSEYCEKVMKESGEDPITSYCPNPAEWFAEVFRLFVTNPGLLNVLRPTAYEILTRKWRPVGTMDWRKGLGGNVPKKIIRTLINKGIK
jgi:hypothetical protein